MAGVFWGGGRADEVADFDEYDPTPYGGGYDIALTFGRPLPPSEEICYPISTTSTTASSYDRPQQHGGRRLGTEESHGGPAAASYGGGYARGPTKPHEEDTHGSVASGYGYGRKGHDDEHAAYPKPKPAAAYGGDDDEQAAYRKPKPAAYGDERPSYGRKKNDDDDDSDDDDRRKQRYKKKDDDDDDDSDDDKKKRYEKNNRRRRDYDD
ncbi:hypothetical protein HU200_002050 [Digitaria exilis]|uniref:Uncharacterized protein n=1 Tax=Digitaria exilis TaxID=1010633 RepID=A0A835FW19_9POAL|nr:hypothetical protein HU200_002050 [Digitaria exilis]CAB3448138.1 unnamed protein product [Digitaria exilis]